MRRQSITALLALTLSLTACKPSSPSAETPTPSTPVAATQTYPPRPTQPPPPFRVFHHDATSYTLVTTPNATDADIAAILYQLRDAAQHHTFDTLHLSQKDIDARDPIVWFHLYRNPKCAPEKYAPGHPPCGPSYHAAGDFTYGGFTNHNRMDAIILHDEDHQTQLWNPDAPTNH